MNVEYPTSLPPGRYPSPNDSREVVSTPLNHRDEEALYEWSHFETTTFVGLLSVTHPEMHLLQSKQCALAWITFDKNI